MATIRCKACGKHYSYEKEGCCPECGAYNRPPKREVVNADGTIQHMTDAAYEKRRGAAGKVCFEEKECHEEKVCYEDQARHGHKATRQKTGQAAQSAAAFLNQFTARTSGGKNKSGRLPVVGIVIAVIVIVNLLMSGLGGLLDQGVDYWEDRHPEPDAETVIPMDPGDEYFYDAGMGDELVLLDGTTLAVMSWDDAGSEEEIRVMLDADFADSDHEYYATLLCTDEYGEVQYLDDLTVETTEEGLLVLHFTTGDGGTWMPFGLILDEWSGEEEISSWTVDLR